MTELDSDLLSDFGAALFSKRNMLGKNQSQIKSADVSVISKLENGKHAGISAKVVSRIVKELGMDAEWTDRFIEFELAKKRKRTEQILKFADADDLARASAKDLLLGLADKFAGDDFQDAFSAYQALRAALEEAEKLKSKGAMPHNLSEQMQAVLQRVAAHNDRGDFDAGQDEISLAFDKNEAEVIALCNHAVNQARLQNDPKLAARMTIKRLALEVRPDELYSAILSDVEGFEQNMYAFKHSFSLKVSQELLRENTKLATKKHLGKAYYNYSRSCYAIAVQELGTENLKLAQEAAKLSYRESKGGQDRILQGMSLSEFAECERAICERTNTPVSKQAEEASRRGFDLIKKSKKASKSDRNYVAVQLGRLLSFRGYQAENVELLSEAITILRRVFDSEGSHSNNLGLTYMRRFRVKYKDEDAQHSKALLKLAINDDCDETSISQAFALWNLADLELAIWEIQKEKTSLASAQKLLSSARAIFEQGLSEFQLNKCDELQAQIDAARV